MRSLADQEIFTQPTLPKAEYSFHVTKFDVVSTSADAALVHWTHMGMMEARLVVKGAMVIAGIRDSAVPGETFRQKQEYLMQTSAHELDQMIRSDGWLEKFFPTGLTADNKSMIAIPTGFVLLQAWTDCTYIRWNFIGDAGDMARAKIALQNMIDSFPDVKAGCAGVAEYARFIGCRV